VATVHINPNATRESSAATIRVQSLGGTKMVNVYASDSWSRDIYNSDVTMFLNPEEAKNLSELLVPPTPPVESKYTGQQYGVYLYSHGPKKIEVIKVVRELTGLELKTAKDLVDSACFYGENKNGEDVGHKALILTVYHPRFASIATNMLEDVGAVAHWNAIPRVS